MSLNDSLSNALSTIMNAERAGKKVCLVNVSSKLIKKVLVIMNDNGYIGEFKAPEERKEALTINLLGQINKCNSIKPRYSVKSAEFEKFESRFLPAQDFGILIVSTSKGLMTHYDAKKKKLGGKLIAYCY